MQRVQGGNADREKSKLDYAAELKLQMEEKKARKDYEDE
jgi:hypothetical protein